MKKCNLRLVTPLLVIILCTISTGTLLAQVVTGTVKDQGSQPIRGVAIKERNSTNKTVTNDDGTYSIKISSDSAVLVFTHVGMDNAVERVKGRRVIDVVMNMKLSELDDVVVIGYNTAKRKDVTASVSSVSKEAMSERTLFSLADAIKGKAAGVNIIQNDGTPGSENTIRIRGASSVSAASTPLFVVDGILQDDANNINPGDIESIEILKDASGTAIYGSRGANGVIIITTRSGKVGRTIVDLYSNTAFQRPGHLVEMMNAQEYARARFLASAYTYSAASATNPNVPATTLTGYTYYRDQPLGKAGAGFWGVAENQTYHDWEKYGSPDSVNTDWQRAMFQNSMLQEYRLGVTGGSATTRFSFSGSYLDQGGLVIYSNYKRFNGRFNLTQKLSKTVTLTTNISASTAITDGFITGSLNGGVSSNAVITAILNKPPVEPLTQTDVDDNSNVDDYVSTNPYTLAKGTTNKKTVTDWITRFALDWNINKNLFLRVTGNYTNTTPNTDAYYPKYTAAGSRFKGRAYLSRANTIRMMNENLLYYNGRIGKEHRFNAMAGAIFEQSKTNVITAENQNYDIETLGVYGLQNGTIPIVPTYNTTKWTMASFLARLEYGYKGRYLFTGTFRADGSSRFSRNNKWGYFPSAGFAWRISEESFMKKLPFISNLKLRTSIGQSGNTAIPTYLTLSTIGTYFSPMDGNTPNYGVVVDRPENLSLKWETTTQVNGGLDIGFLGERFGLTVEWYSKRTKDLLIQRVVPGYSGYRTAWTNLGSIQNTGVEINLTANLLTKRKFSWKMDANIGFNRSKAVDIGPDLGLDPGVVASVGTSAIIRNGQAIGQWYGYVTNGIFQSQEEINASGFTSINGQAISAIRPGSRKFIDQNGDNIINAEDRVVLGKGQPNFTGGFTNTFTYLGISLNVIFQYSVGNKIYNANRVTLEQGRNPINMTKALADSWRPSLYDMTTGALVQEGNPSNSYRMPGNASEQIMLSDWIEDGSYIRLADITLSFTLLPKWIKKIGMSGATLFASGKNLWISTKYSGYDPEVNTRQGGFGDLMPSLDYASYPRSRFYSFGVKAQF